MSDYKLKSEWEQWPWSKMGAQSPVTPVGWQCPTCRRCYAPTTALCFYCPEKIDVKIQPNSGVNNP